MLDTRRPWYSRNSYRILILVATIFVVFVVITANRALSRKAAIEAINERGGLYDGRVEGPQWLRNLIGDERYLYNASKVSFGPSNDQYDPSDPFTDSDLDEIVDHLNAFSGFYHLDLRRTAITDDGLAHLKRLRKLQVLTLDGTAISDAGLVHLEKQRALRQLAISQTQVTVEAASRLQHRIPSCEIIRQP
jgi:hypothetical protein